MPTVALVGTFDSKGPEYAFVAERLTSHGIDVVTIDAGVLGEPAFEATVSRSEVANAAGADLEALRSEGDRGRSITVMSKGAAVVLRDLFEQGRVDGALGLGGTGGTSISARAFRTLPLGVPKLIVSTAASGNTYPYVQESDLVLMPSVVDVAGINRISALTLSNAAAAIAGMVCAPHGEPTGDDRPLVAASMFGVTTPCVQRARQELEDRGYEVLVFHMTGTGGRVLESLASQGMLAGVLDVTTTELADELVGGVFSAGPERLTGAGRAGIPQVVSVGALDMVNFGPTDTVPAAFEGRNFYVHNPTTTLMRTTPEECVELGSRLAARLVRGTGPTTVFLPQSGVSLIATEGGPFFDRDADKELFDAVRDGVRGSSVKLVEMPTDINDERFALAMVEELDSMIRGQQ